MGLAGSRAWVLKFSLDMIVIHRILSPKFSYT